MIAEFTAAIAATIYFFKYKQTEIRWLLLLLWYIALNERVAKYYVVLTETSNTWIYNIYDIVVCLGLLYIIRSQLIQKLHRKIVLYFIGLSFVLFVINYILLDPLKNPSFFAFSISSVLIVISVLFYLVRILYSASVENVSRDLFLWIAAGFLIFHISYPVIYIARVYFPGEKNQYLTSLYMIQGIVVVISYLTIAFGFIWGAKRIPTFKKKR